MGYLGNTPALNFISFAKQVFTIVNSQTAYTLDHKVTNENDIRLVINNVVQEPGSGKAYTASGNTLTLSSALVNGTDEMYCVFLGKAVQTVNAPNASVGSDQTASTIITGQTAETSIATDDTILIHDTSASALRKMTRANFVSGVGGTNTPAFAAKTVSASWSNNSDVKIIFTAEDYDTASAYDTSTGKFTVPSGQAGKYYLKASLYLTANGNSELKQSAIKLYKNGTNIKEKGNNHDNNPQHRFTLDVSAVLDLSASDYIEVYGRVEDSSGTPGILTGAEYNYFEGFKLVE